MLLRELKRKIGVIKNIAEITEALELISAVKMRKAQELAIQSRPFLEKVVEILFRLQIYEREFPKDSIFFRKSFGKKLAVVVTSDKGFCGAFNKNIFNFVEKEIDPHIYSILPVGRKGVRYFKKRGYEVIAEFIGMGDFGEFEEIRPIAKLLIGYFKSGRFSEISLIFNDFISPFLQKPIKLLLLPLDIEKTKELLDSLREKLKIKTIEKEIRYLEYIFEPSQKEIFEGILPLFIEYLVYHSILEANASEHSARMLAMREASDNANEIFNNLQLEYYKERQAQITSEIIEITSAKEAML